MRVNDSNAKEIFNKIVNKEITKFGLPDPQDMFDSYFPCQFVKVVDEDSLKLEVYEPSIGQYHIVNINNLFIVNKEDEI